MSQIKLLIFENIRASRTKILEISWLSSTRFTTVEPLILYGFRNYKTRAPYKIRGNKIGVAIVYIFGHNYIYLSYFEQQSSNNALISPLKVSTRVKY